MFTGFVAIFIFPTVKDGIIPQISFLYNQQNATSAYGQLHIHHHFCKTDTGNDDLSSDGYIHLGSLTVEY